MSKVIKSDPEGTADTSAPRARAVIPAVVYDAESEAQRVLAEAAERAAAILRDARADASRLREAAVSEGRREGAAQAAAMAVAAEALRARVLADTEDDVARLAVQIARKILEGELSQGPEAIGRIVAAALQSARLGRAVIVRVHPDALAPLEAEHPRLAAAAGRSEGLVLRADPAIDPGGCTVESELGTVDARLDTQLAAIERALTAVREGA